MMQNRTALAGLVLSFAVAIPAAAQAAAPGGACAAKALKSATERAHDEDPKARMKSFAKVEPAKTEVGAGDQVFDARFAASAGGEDLRYHLIMWCKGMKAPLTMALQRKYD